jgi:hypothetical protein
MRRPSESWGGSRRRSIHGSRNGLRVGRKLRRRFIVDRLGWMHILRVDKHWSRIRRVIWKLRWCWVLVVWINVITISSGRTIGPVEHRRTEWIP